MIKDFRPHHEEKGITITYWAQVTVKRFTWSNGETKLIWRNLGCGWRWDDTNKPCPLEVEALEEEFYERRKDSREIIN